MASRAKFRAEIDRFLIGVTLRVALTILRRIWK